MFVTQSLDFAHSVIVRVNSDRHGLGILVAIVAFAGVFLPTLLGVAGTSGMSKRDALAYLPLSFLLALGYTCLRQRSLSSLRQSLDRPVPYRERLTAFIFLFTATALTALTARVSQWAAPVVFVLLCALPWQRWAIPSGAP